VELSRPSYSQAIDIHDYRTVFCVAIAFIVPVPSFAFVIGLGTIASRTSLSVLYIGLPATLITCAALAYPIIRFMVRLDRARFDERHSEFLSTRAARWTNIWLQYVSFNLAPVEGQPKRWYQHKIGKFS